MTPLNSTFKLVTTLHSTLDILDFFKELFVKFTLLNFQLLGLYLKRTFFVSILYNRLVQCKNLPFSNRWPQTLGSCSMSSAPPLPATKKNNQNTSQSLRQFIKIFHTITPFIGRHFSNAQRLCLVNPPSQSYCLTIRNFYQNRVINHLIEYGVKGHG